MAAAPAPAETAPAGQPRAPKAAVSGPKRAYLVAYNGLSAALWSVVLARTVGALCAGGPEAVYPAVGEWTKWTQTLAALEVVHSLLGESFSPPSFFFVFFFGQFRGVSSSGRSA